MEVLVVLMMALRAGIFSSYKTFVSRMSLL